MIYTNRCKHCGKIKSAHYVPPNKTGIYCTDDNENFDSFEDSGLAALDAHKEELYLGLVGYFSGLDNCDIDREIIKLEPFKKEK